jgi:hypothetical protein
LSRDVVAGDQLFVEYDGFMHSSPLEARRERLSKWIDGPCLCTRCVREEELAAALASVHAAAASEKRKFHQKLSVVACGHDDDDDDEIANRVSLSLGILVFLWTCL